MYAAHTMKGIVGIVSDFSAKMSVIVHSTANRRPSSFSLL
jgi:hypothetical protein